MKKIISVILCALIALSSCFVTAFAADEDKEFNNIYIVLSTMDSDDTMFVITLDDKYVSFDEDLSVDFTTFSSNVENIHRDEIDETNATFTTVTFSGDNLVPVKEKPSDKDEDGEYSYNPFLAIYIPHAGDIGYHNFYKAEIPENTVFDAQGNGNEKITLEFLYTTALHVEGDCGYVKGGFPEKTRLYSYICIPVDYYLDGELVAENSIWYMKDKAETGTHTLTAKKFGIVIDEETFDVYEINKFAAIAEIFGGAGLEVVVYLLTSLWSVPLSGLLFLIFPPLGIAGLAAPFASLYTVFSAIVTSFTVLFR